MPTRKKGPELGVGTVVVGDPSAKFAYMSDIELGVHYTEPRLDLGGHASTLTFFENACERVGMEYVHERKVMSVVADAKTVVRTEDASPVGGDKPGGATVTTEVN